MREELLKESFEKAGELIGNDSLNSRAIYLADYISDDFKYPITAKSLIRYYKGESTPRLEVLEGLAAFLGMKDYEHYLQSRKPEKQEERERLGFRKEKRPGKKELWLLVGFLLVALGAPAYHALVKEDADCIAWVGTEYEAVPCSGSELEMEFNQDLLDNFKRIEVTGQTEFFRHGRPQIWYYKNGGELEYYTAPGLHPENKMTLKPITKYMINKYVKGK